MRIRMTFRKYGLLRSALSCGAVALLSLGLSGCVEGDGVNRWVGRYVGTEVGEKGSSQEILALVQSYSSSGGTSGAGTPGLAFQAFSVGGVAKPQEYRILFRSDSEWVFSSASVQGKAVLLRKIVSEPECSAGEGEGVKARVCLLAAGETRAFPTLLITAQGLTKSGEEIRLTLEQRDDLPILKRADGAYTIEQLVTRAKFANYTVREQAERVYQARAGVAAARGRLLPSLNFGTILGYATSGAGGLIESIGNLLPFLFPSNWFRFEKAKELFQAERMAFASLRGNEMNAVEQLAYATERDQVMANEMGAQVAWMRKIQQSLLVEEESGALARGTARFFGATLARVEQDRIAMDALVEGQMTELSFGVALPVVDAIHSLQPIDLPDLSKIGTLDPAPLTKTARENSVELRSLKHVLSAAEVAEKEISFGIFDPSGGGLGFGTPAEIRGSRANQSEIRARIEETEALIERRAVELAIEQERVVESYRIAMQGLGDTRAQSDWLLQRHLNGETELTDDEFVRDLSELQERALSFNSARLSAAFGYLMLQARVNRLSLNGFYSDLETVLPLDPDRLVKEAPTFDGPNPSGVL